MKLFNTTKFENLDDLLIEQIEDLYDAETRLCDALPKMSEAASDPQLVKAFGEHLSETKQQRTRLEEAFRMLGREPSRETCDAMKGLISEGEDMIEAEGEPHVRDAALIAAAQRIEHYEMAGYGTVCSFARRCERDDVADLLGATLEEEKAADAKLTSIAEASVNMKAARA